MSLFNPMAFLTAVQQVVARKRSLPLDNMTISTDVTIYRARKTSTPQRAIRWRFYSRTIHARRTMDDSRGSKRQIKLG